MNDLEKQLPRLRIENEYGAVDRLCSQVPFECLVNRNSVDICVVHEPNDLVREDLSVVLRVEIWLRGFTRIELKALADSLAQHVKRGVRLHDLAHCLLQELLAPMEPIAEA